MLAVLSAVTLVLAGCTSSSDDNPASSSPVNTTATSSSVASSPAGSETGTPDDLTAKLLALEDLGGGFDQAQFQESNQSLPCTPDAPALGEQVPDAAHAGTAFTHRSVQAAVAEDLKIYSDAATAERAFTAARDGLDCASGTFNLTGTPQTFQFSDIQDVAGQTHADQAIAVQATSAKVDVVFVACQVGNALVLLNFLKAPDAQVESLPSPVFLATLAVTKAQLG